MIENQTHEEFLEQQEGKTKEEHVRDFINSIKAVEANILPFKEHLKELRQEYVDKGWLSKEEISLAKKLKKAVEDEVTLEQIQEIFQAVEKGMKNA